MGVPIKNTKERGPRGVYVQTLPHLHPMAPRKEKETIQKEEQAEIKSLMRKINEKKTQKMEDTTGMIGTRRKTQNEKKNTPNRRGRKYSK